MKDWEKKRREIKVRARSELTEIQKLVVMFWNEFLEINKRTPTLKEAMIEMGYSSPSSVQRHLLALKKKGIMDNPHRRWCVL